MAMQQILGQMLSEDARYYGAEPVEVAEQANA
jgi:hypothetical protein